MPTEADTPVFEGQELSHVCSTYALAREFEWAGRHLYLKLRGSATLPGPLADTEAVGTQVKVIHKKRVAIGIEIYMHAEATTYEDGWLRCRIKATQADVVVAEGSTTQKVRST